MGIVKLLGTVVDSVAQYLRRLGDYNRWTRSIAGKRHASRKKENRVLDNMRDGDMDTVAGDIKDKQKRINRARRELGILLILSCICGCVELRPLPADIDPHEYGLKDAERIYRVEDVPLQTDRGEVELEGKWYVISADFMRTHRENQDDLLDSYARLKTVKRNWLLVIISISAAALLVVILLARKGVGQVVKNLKS